MARVSFCPELLLRKLVESVPLAPLVPLPAKAALLSAPLEERLSKENTPLRFVELSVASFLCKGCELIYRVNLSALRVKYTCDVLPLA